MFNKLRLIAGLIIISLCIATACKRTMTHDEVEFQLKKAMERGLYETINNDSSKTKFEVLKVAFFEDKNFYDCEFIVRLKEPGYDTTGSMAAYITKDFKKMNRKY